MPDPDLRLASSMAFGAIILTVAGPLAGPCVVLCEKRQKGLVMVGVLKSAKRRLVPVNDAGRRIGEDHPRAVLTDHEVDLVHELQADGMGLSEIARKMEVSKGCIWKILHGYRRGQVPARWRVRGEPGGA